MSPNHFVVTHTLAAIAQLKFTQEQMTGKGQKQFKEVFDEPCEDEVEGYEDEIKTPMSYLKIETKAKAYSYKNAQELMEDMGLIFMNAMQFNSPENRPGMKDLYEYAVVLFSTYSMAFDDALEASGLADKYPSS